MGRYAAIRRAPARAHGTKFDKRSIPRNVRVATISQSPRQCKFSKEFPPIETLKLIIEPMLLQTGDDAYWIGQYYQIMKEGAKNGDQVAHAAKKPKKSILVHRAENTTSGLLDQVEFKRQYELYDARMRAAQLMTQALTRSISCTTLTYLESMPPAALGLPDGFEDFDAYINSTGSKEKDPVLVYNMIVRAIIQESVGSTPGSIYVDI